MEFDTVITVVDFMSQRINFISTQITDIVESAARLFLQYVWKLHAWN